MCLLLYGSCNINENENSLNTIVKSTLVSMFAILKYLFCSIKNWGAVPLFRSVMNAWAGAARRRVHLATVLPRPPSGQRLGSRWARHAHVPQMGLHLTQSWRLWHRTFNSASDGSLYLTTPIDRIFLILPYLIKAAEVRFDFTVRTTPLWVEWYKGKWRARIFAQVRFPSICLRCMTYCTMDKDKWRSRVITEAKFPPSYVKPDENLENMATAFIACSSYSRIFLCC